MNTIYRLIRNRVSNVWVAVAEGTRGSRKGRGNARGASTGAVAAHPVFGAVVMAFLPDPGARRVPPGFVLRVPLAVLLGLTALGAHAGPDGGAVTAGSGSIERSGAVTTITQSSRNMSLNWSSFDIDKGETVNFVQPSATALAVNRVIGDKASQILGNLNANGQVYLINPHGILFGQGAQVNVGALVASTLDLQNDGDGSHRRFEAGGAGNGAGGVVNRGSLNANGAGGVGGYIALLGGQVVNEGVVTARLGSVAMAAGNLVTLDFSNSGLVNVQVEKSVFDTLVENRVLVVADGGLVVMTAGARDSLQAGVVNNGGVIQARGLERQGGKIVLTADGVSGRTAVAGTLDVTSTAGGGTIAIGGRAIELAGALLDASGDGGGGAIAVGGGALGRPVAGIATAQTVSVDRASLLRASAGSSGDGGEIVIWSDRVTRFEGSIDARALGAATARVGVGIVDGANAGNTANPGNGGNAEVSSAGLLDYRGMTNLLSSRGATGNLLLDPWDITISNAVDNNADGGAGGFTASGNASNINVATLRGALAGANVTVSTGAAGSAGGQGGNITVVDPLSWAGATSLTLNAAGNIAINAPVSGTSAGSSLILSAGAGRDIGATGAINVGAFNLLQGNWVQNNGVLPGFAAGSFTVGAGATFLRAGGGDGSSARPYLLSDIYGLQGVGSQAGYRASNYLLRDNIDASGTAGWNGGAGFLPIGTVAAPFRGSLSGDNRAIVNLSIARPTMTSGVGLFGALDDANVSNLSLLNATVSGGNGTGALAGRVAGNSILSGVTVTGAVTGANTAGSDNIGGIVGEMTQNARLAASASAALVTGYYNATGGAVGAVGGAANVVATTSATGIVTGASRTGGLVGSNAGAITDSYANASVSQAGGNTAGGLAGVNTGSISRSYSAGAMSGSAASGGFVGANAASIVNSRWNTTTSARAAGAGTDTSGGGIAGLTGQNTAAMRAQTGFAGWDFADTWYLTPNFSPTLRAGTTIVGGAGNMVVSALADSATNINAASLKNLLGAGNVLVAARNGTLALNSAVDWNSGSQLGLAASGALTVAAAGNLTAASATAGMSLVSYANGIAVSGATLRTQGGDLSLLAPKSGAAIGLALANTAIDVGVGTASLLGASTGTTGVNFTGANSLLSSGEGRVEVAGSSRSGRGILFSTGTALNTGGTTTIEGNSIGYVGIAFCGSACTTSVTHAGGDLRITGNTLGPSSASGIDMFGQTLTNAGTGAFIVTGSSLAGSPGVAGMNISAGTATLNNLNGGVLSINGNSNAAEGIYLSASSAVVANGNVSITGKSNAAGAGFASFLSAGAHSYTSNNGTLTLIGGDAGTRARGFAATGNLLLNTNASGVISINGFSSASNGIDITGATAISTTGAGRFDFTGGGAGSGTARDISIAVSGAVTLNNGMLTGVNGQGVGIASSAGAIVLSNQRIDTRGGALNLASTTSGNTVAVTLNNTAIDVGAGAGGVTGTSATGIGVNFTGANRLTADPGGSLTVTGNTNGTPAGALNLAANGSLTTAGTINLAGNATIATASNSYGLNVGAGAMVIATEGDLSLSGAGTTARGVQLSGSLDNRGAGTLSVLGTSASNQGIIANNTRTYSAATATYAGSNIVITGRSVTNNGISNGGVVETGGAVAFNGYSGSLRGIDEGTVVWTNRSGTLSLTGVSDTYIGIRSSGTYNTYGNLNMNGDGGVIGLYFRGANFANLGSGLFTMDGRATAGAAAAESGAGVKFIAPSYNFRGAISVTGVSTLPVGPFRSRGIEFAGGTFNNSGALRMTGISGDSTSAGIEFSGNTVFNNSGSLTLAGSSTVDAGAGTWIPAGVEAVSSGDILVTDAATSAAGNAFEVDGKWTASAGTLAVAPASQGGIAIAAGAVVNARGDGDLALRVLGGGRLSNLGAIVQEDGSAGSILLSTVDGDLINGGTISGGDAAAAITLRASGAGAIDNRNGGIDQRGAGAIMLRAAGAGVDAGAIAYSNAAANTLSVAGNGVRIAGALVSSGGRLDVKIDSGDGITTLASTIVSAGGDITIGKAAVLEAATVLDARTDAGAPVDTGAGRIALGSSLDGGQDFTALAASIGLAGPLGSRVALGNVALTSAGSLNLPSIAATGLLADTVGADADIALAPGARLALSGSGDAAILAAGRNFYNDAGANAIGMTGGGRWLVYSATPSANRFAGLDSGNTAIWGSRYETTRAAPFADAGNRYVFAYRPTLTLASTDARKTYGDDGRAALAQAFAVTGLEAGVQGAYSGDTLARVLQGAPSLTSAGAAREATVTGGPYRIGIAAGSTAAAAGYDLAYRFAGMLVVDPAPLTAIVADATKTYDGRAFSGGAIGGFSGFVNGDTGAVLSGAPVYGGAAQGARATGRYALSVAGLFADNYAITTRPGELRIVEREPVPGAGEVLNWNHLGGRTRQSTVGEPAAGGRDTIAQLRASDENSRGERLLAICIAKSDGSGERQTPRCGDAM